MPKDSVTGAHFEPMKIADVLKDPLLLKEWRRTGKYPLVKREDAKDDQ